MYPQMLPSVKHASKNVLKNIFSATGSGRSRGHAGGTSRAAPEPRRDAGHARLPAHLQRGRLAQSRWPPWHPSNLHPAADCSARSTRHAWCSRGCERREARSASNGGPTEAQLIRESSKQVTNTHFILLSVSIFKVFTSPQQGPARGAERHEPSAEIPNLCTQPHPLIHPKRRYVGKTSEDGRFAEIWA